MLSTPSNTRGVLLPIWTCTSFKPNSDDVRDSPALAVAQVGPLLGLTSALRAAPALALLGDLGAGEGHDLGVLRGGDQRPQPFQQGDPVDPRGRADRGLVE